MAGAGGVLDVVRAGGLLDEGRPVVVLLSGGRDSVCLLDVAVALAGRGSVSALHVNYSLREDARADESLCAELCRRLEVQLTVERPGSGPKGNLQAWARDVRYGAATRLALQLGADVAAGHTATDQAETILYRLAASPGRRALLGIRPRDGRLVRPLLGVSREQTASHCRARGLAWREDSSNASERFARNRIRHGLAAALRDVHPAAEANVVRTAELLRDEAEVLDELVAQVLEGSDEIELERLAALPPALGRLVVRRLAEDASGELAPRAAARVPELERLGEDCALDLGDGVRARVNAGRLRFERTPPLPSRTAS